MTSNPSVIVTNRNHRLHDRLFTLCISVSALCISSDYLLGRPPRYNDGDAIALECKQADLVVRLPIFGPLELALSNKYPDYIEINVTKKYECLVFTEWAAGLGKRGILIGGFIRIIPHIFSPIFVDFYETYRPWLEKEKGHRRNWTETWRFARAIRNSVSHGRGEYLHDRNDPPVTWRNIVYDSSYNGRKTIGGDLTGGDVILLMFDMHEDLNSIGCMS